MELFISHATEDKPDFVRPLADALRAHHRVWYDEYELTLGDSLLRKIDEGLRRCDYGVVVLSRDFFSKRWPRAELDGLFALETSTRKIILPIWKDVTAAEVAEFSPILAGRMAIAASEGIPAVVAAINRAVEVSARTRDLDALGSAAERMRRLDSGMRTRREVDELLRSVRGAGLVWDGFNGLISTLEATLAEFNRTSTAFKFNSRRSDRDNWHVHGPSRMSLGIGLANMAMNSAHGAFLRVRFFQRNHGSFGEAETPDILDDEQYPVSLELPATVVWCPREASAGYAQEEMAARLIGRLTRHIEENSRES